MKITRSSLFVGAIMVLILAGCGQQTENANAKTIYESTEEKANETISADEIGQYDFDGKTFSIVSCKDFFFSPYDVEEQTGDVLDDAVYNRNHNIGERFDCVIDYVILPGSFKESADAVKTSVTSGSNDYSLGIVHPFGGLTGLIAGGYVIDWNKVPVINFAKPWWNRSFNENLSIGGILPCASSDFIYFNSGCIYFNKDILNENNLISPYDRVRSGTWTWDALAEDAKSVYLDVNGDGINNAADRFGYSVINNHRIIPVSYSCGIMSTSRDKDGYPVIEPVGSEKMHDIVSAFNHLLHENEGVLLLNGDELVPFRNAQVLYLHYVTQNAIALRDIAFDFGILPQPKYTEEQEAYYSLAQSNIMIIPSTAVSDDLEFIGVVIEALSAHSYFKVLPALYETTFNYKYLRDEDSIEMFNIIKESLVYDVLWNYTEGNAVAYFLSNLVSKDSSDTASFYAANHEAVNKHFREFYDITIEAFGGDR